MYLFKFLIHVSSIVYERGMFPCISVLVECCFINSSRNVRNLCCCLLKIHISLPYLSVASDVVLCYVMLCYAFLFYSECHFLQNFLFVIPLILLFPNGLYSAPCLNYQILFLKYLNLKPCQYFFSSITVFRLLVSLSHTPIDFYS
jgi:hypothetical protein